MVDPSQRPDDDRLVRDYYNHVDFGPERPFDPDRWSRRLAEDYNYVGPDGVPYLGKAKAVEEVSQQFAAFTSIRSNPTVLSSKELGPNALSFLLNMNISAVTKDRQNVNVASSVLLNFRDCVGDWLVTDEIAVITIKMLE